MNILQVWHVAKLVKKDAYLNERKVDLEKESAVVQDLTEALEQAREE